MQKLSLNGLWDCRLPDGQTLGAEVPGCFDVHAPAWDIGRPVRYQKRFFLDAPASRSRLTFGAVSYHCQVWLNGVDLGSHEGMWDRFSLPACQALRAGENLLEMDVTKPGYASDDPFPLREVLSGFLPDVLATFGGPWDDVMLESAPHFFVDAHSAGGGCDGRGEARMRVDTDGADEMRATLCIYAPDGAQVFCHSETRRLPSGESEWRIPFELSVPDCWSPRHPALYRYEWMLEAGGQRETRCGRFGLREIRADGSRILLNGEPIYMHGVLHWGYHERQMIPRFADDDIRRELEQVRASGFNAVKHCLYIPRQNYLDLMDECGLLCWVELPLWLPEPTPQLNARIRREYPRLLDQLRGHPSLMVVSLGCELNDAVDGQILEEMYHLARERLHVLVRDNSGSGECYGGLAVDYADFFDYHFYAELPHMEQLLETFTPSWRSTRPWMFGEFADSDTMRDLSLIRAARGVERLVWELDDLHRNPISGLKPDFHAGAHEESMLASGIRRDWERIHALSLRHSMVHRKVTLEMTRSFQEVSGYNITHLCDVPIATSGLLDDLGQMKFDPRQMRMFNGDRVLVPAWDLTRIWVGADRVNSRERYNFQSGAAWGLHVLLSNYGPEDVTDGVLRYRLTQDGRCLQEGALPCGTLVHGKVAEAACIRLTLPRTERPLLLHMEVSLDAPECLCENVFPIFVYPPAGLKARRLALYDPCGALQGLDACCQAIPLRDGQAVPDGCEALVTSLLDRRAKDYLQASGRVVLVQTGDGELPVIHGPMWREGMIRAFDHPVMAEIPQEDWLDDLRYFSMTTDVAFAPDAMPGSVPVLRRYDCRLWQASNYLMFFPYGGGMCAATTLRLAGGLGKTPCGLDQNPFSVYLLERMLDALKA